MWLKYLIITPIFYFFAVLQNSFLVHFNISGIIPNFILIFFFLLIFFEKPDKYYLGLFASIVAGFFLDVFSYSYFGVSIISLLIMVFLIKKTLQLLWDRSDERSIFYFIPLFTAYFIIYNMFLNVSLNWTFLIAIIYNLAFALLGFYIYLKFNIK